MLHRCIAANFCMCITSVSSCPSAGRNSVHVVLFFILLSNKSLHLSYRLIDFTGKCPARYMLHAIVSSWLSGVFRLARHPCRIFLELQHPALKEGGILWDASLASYCFETIHTAGMHLKMLSRCSSSFYWRHSCAFRGIFSASCKQEGYIPALSCIGFYRPVNCCCGGKKQ